MSDPIISVSGLRGIVGEGLTPEVASRYVASFAAECPPGPIVVSRDGRFSGDMLAKAVQAGLQAVGRDTLDAGIAPTPTLGILVRHVQAAGGVQVSASHNPPEYNGLKLFSAEGRVLPAGPGQKVLARYRSSTPAWARHDGLGRSGALAEPLIPHLDAVLATVDVARIRRKRFRVLLDSNHGAGGGLGRRLLESLGCWVAVSPTRPNLPPKTSPGFWRKSSGLGRTWAFAKIRTRIGWR